MLIGHEKVAQALSRELPSVFSISGPASVGKRILAAGAAIKHGVSRIDFTESMNLTVSEASRVKDFMSVAPMGDFKFALMHLDGAKSAAMDKLLLTLEDSPETAKYCLITSQPLPKTIRTRAQNYSVGILDSDNLVKILTSQNISYEDAAKLADLGTVEKALAAYDNSPAKYVVINAFQAVEANDFILLMQTFKGVDDYCARLIVRALQESASGQWNIFTQKSLGAFGKKEVALKILGVWSTMSEARPKLAVRTALESVMRG